MKTLILAYICFVIFLPSDIEANGKSDETCVVKNEGGFSYAQCDSNLARKYSCSLSQNQQSWLKSLYDAALLDRTINKRKRREIRLLSEEERNNFFKAVNTLKHDRSVPPNKFDVLALVHTNNTICSVHRGSNFLGWHRVYLLLFETALRQTDKTVVLPYWNSAMDNNEITRPVNSVIFSDKFLGNGNGNVNTGPFRNWKDFRGCPLPRNISVGKPLLSPEIVNMIETCDSVNLTESVVDGGPSCASLTIEGQHNLVHDWVGGDMGDLALSANDPAFILHHAFADYIWEKFRQKQRKLGINPEMDYPSIGKVTKNSDLRKFHVANRTMDCFPWITNMEGYWNNFTDLYEYEDSPTCPSCGNSKYLTCNMAINVCIGNVPKPPNALMSTHLTLIIAVVSILGVLTILSAALACVSGYRSRNKPRIGEKERLLANSADLHTKIHT